MPILKLTNLSLLEVVTTSMSDKMVFVILVAITFQSVFCLEMYQNNIFFKKNILNINILKWSKNTKKKINLNQKNKN